MKTRIAVIIVMLLGALCPFQAALASDLFYEGNIIIDSIGIRIEANDEATVKAIYLLTNRGSEDEEVDLQSAQSPVPLEEDGEELSNPVSFRPGERKFINLTYKLNITGETTKMLFLDPTMLFDGKPNSEPAKALLIKVLLPQGINGLAWANQEPDDEGLEDSRKFYSWSGVDIYPTILCLKWSTLQVELSVEKSVRPQEITTPGQIINVVITIENKGDTVANKIGLTDEYSAFDFEAVEPLWEFGRQESWLFWRKNIGSMAPGEIRIFAYSVRYTGFSSQSYDFDLRPCVVTVDGHLMYVSNKLRMSQRGGETPAPTDSEVPIEAEAQPLRFPSVTLLGGILLILATLRGGYLIWRWRRSRQ
jgi:hypothetical protein